MDDATYVVISANDNRYVCIADTHFHIKVFLIKARVLVLSKRLHPQASMSISMHKGRNRAAR